MFDMGFTELVLIGIVALIVIGPERLPGVARTAGKYFGKLRYFVSTVKADVENELRADEWREILKQEQGELESLKQEVADVGSRVGDSVDAIKQSMAEKNGVAVESNSRWTDGMMPPSTVKPDAEPGVAKPPEKSLAKPKVAQAQKTSAKNSKP